MTGRRRTGGTSDDPNQRARTRKTRPRGLTAGKHVSRGELGAIELAERLTALATSPGGIRFDVPLDYAEMCAAQHGIAPHAIRAALDHLNRQRDPPTSADQRRRPVQDAAELRSDATGWLAS
jgi:hypothetical protein